MVQSHGMHFFHLAAPDLVLGFDADPAIRNVFGIIQADPQLALKAVNLRRYGQQIIERLGGQARSPQFCRSRRGQRPSEPQGPRGHRRRTRSHGRDRQGGGRASARAGWRPTKTWPRPLLRFPSNYMGLVDMEGGLQLYDGEIRVKDDQGKFVAQFKPEHYLSHVAEHVEPWSFLKFPYYRKLGWPKGTYRVGPLGRLNVVDKIGTPLANEEFKLFRQINGGKPVEGSLFYHYARLIELVYALERIGQLLDDPDITSTDIRTYPAITNVPGQGVGVIEAPRGTLFHDYSTDENGQLTRVNLIVATGNNNWAMHTASGLVAKAFVDGNKLTEGMLNRVEAAIRCYDPCLSCATHAMGQMPLEITLMAADGTILDRISR